MVKDSDSIVDYKRVKTDDKRMKIDIENSFLV